jgi:hypothetical protein
MRRLRAAVVYLLFAFGCIGASFHPRSANPYEPDRGPESSGGGPGLAPAVAAAASVQRRLERECYVPCLEGTVCNQETGLCDALPCRGECKKGERCDESGIIPKCVAEIAPGLLIEMNLSPEDRRSDEKPPESGAPAKKVIPASDAPAKKVIPPSDAPTREDVRIEPLR